jgi:hypothetical protein
MDGRCPPINGCELVVEFRTFTCRIWGIDSPTLYSKCVLLIKDKVEIKCMGSVGGKIPTEPTLYLLFSSLRHIES